LAAHLGTAESGDRQAPLGQQFAGPDGGAQAVAPDVRSHAVQHLRPLLVLVRLSRELEPDTRLRQQLFGFAVLNHRGRQIGLAQRHPDRSVQYADRGSELMQSVQEYVDSTGLLVLDP
jgi:hypothetical protein